MVALILTLISSMFTAAGKVFEWLYAAKLVDAGRTQAQLEALRNQVHEAQIAIAAREAVRAHVAATNGELPDNDPFLRD